MSETLKGVKRDVERASQRPLRLTSEEQRLHHAAPPEPTETQVLYAFGQGDLDGKALKLTGRVTPPGQGWEIVDPVDNPEAVYVHAQAARKLAEEDERMVKRVQEAIDGFEECRREGDARGHEASGG